MTIYHIVGTDRCAAEAAIPAAEGGTPMVSFGYWEQSSPEKALSALQDSLRGLLKKTLGKHTAEANMGRYIKSGGSACEIRAMENASVGLDQYAGGERHILSRTNATLTIT